MCALLVLATAVLAPAAAHASTAEVGEPGGGPPFPRLDPPVLEGETQLTVTDEVGEPNDITVSRQADDVYLVTDTAGVEPGTGCIRVPERPDAVTCSGAPEVIVHIVVDLRDGEDAVRVDAVPTYADGRIGSTSLSGGQGRDTLVSGPTADDVHGQEGPDVIDAGAGDDILSGEEGDDEIEAGPGDDHVIGYGGPPFIESPEDDDTLGGGDGDDALAGGPGDDTVIAGDGNDSTAVLDLAFVEESGDDAFDGGAGNDALSGGPGEDTVTGGAGDDDLEGLVDGHGVSQGNDSLDGGEGDDVMHSEPEPAEGPDRYRGGAGIDRVDYASRSTAIVATLDGVANDGASGEGDDVGTDVEQVIGGADSDMLVGNDAANLLDGRDGDDVLDGGAGDDLLNGGATGVSGSDSLLGGSGTDDLRGGPGDDSLDGGDGADALDGGSASDALDGGTGSDRLAGGSGLDALAGGDGDDTLDGGAPGLIGADGADTLDGGPGDDALGGGAGNDALEGGPGADDLRGGPARDTVSYEASGDAISVTLDDVANDGAPGERDNVASDVEVVLGGGDEDTLVGSAGGNVLDSGPGEDLVDGGAGTDRLSGGAGIDVIRARDGTADRVSCGGDRDFAIVDPSDSIRDCEQVDSGTRRPLKAGTEVFVRPTRGPLAFRLPQARRYLPLGERLRVPVGATVDSRRGAVAVTAIKNRARRRTHTATFHDGVFKVRQKKRVARPVTEIRLAGGSYSVCPAPARPGRATAAVEADRTVRRLWGRERGNRGRFRTRGRYSSGLVRGTVWLTVDRCDGTLTRVKSGKVLVRDFGLRRTVVVRAGESYLARARPVG